MKTTFSNGDVENAKDGVFSERLVSAREFVDGLFEGFDGDKIRRAITHIEIMRCY